MCLIEECLHLVVLLAVPKYFNCLANWFCIIKQSSSSGRWLNRLTSLIVEVFQNTQNELPFAYRSVPVALCGFSLWWCYLWFFKKSREFVRSVLSSRLVAHLLWDSSCALEKTKILSLFWVHICFGFIYGLDIGNILVVKFMRTNMKYYG